MGCPATCGIERSWGNLQEDFILWTSPVSYHIFFTHIGYNSVIWLHQQKGRLENRLSLWLARRSNCFHVPPNFSVICLLNLSLHSHKDLTSSYHEIYPLFSKGYSSKYLAFTAHNLKSRICRFFFPDFSMMYEHGFLWPYDMWPKERNLLSVQPKSCYLSFPCIVHVQ